MSEIFEICKESNHESFLVENSESISQENSRKYEAGCLKKQATHISLTDENAIVNLDGYHVTVHDLKEHVIDSYMYRNYLKTLMEARK